MVCPLFFIEKSVVVVNHLFAMVGSLWRTVTSSTNAAVKRLVKLASSRRFRKATGTCVVPGATLVSELLLHAGGGSLGAAPAHSLPQLRNAVASRHLLPQQLRQQLEALAEQQQQQQQQEEEAEDRISLFDAAGDAAAVLRRVSMLESAGEGTATIAAEFDIPPHVEYETPCKNRAVEGTRTVGAVDSENGSCSDPNPNAPCRVIVLDGVSDPGNVGAILRSALALGFDTALLLEGCCDPFNPKTIRAARAAQWGMRRLVINSSWSAVAELTAKLNARLVVADSNVQRNHKQSIETTQGSALASPSGQSVVLAVGNESRGLSLAGDSALACEAERIQVIISMRTSVSVRAFRTYAEYSMLNSAYVDVLLLWCAQVPMQNGVESLNVAVAAALLMHRLS